VTCFPALNTGVKQRGTGDTLSRACPGSFSRPGQLFSRATHRLHCFPGLTLVAPFPGLGNDRVRRRVLSRARKFPALGTGRLIWLGVLIGQMSNCFDFISKQIVVPGGEAGDIGGSSVPSPSSALALSLHKPCT